MAEQAETEQTFVTPQEIEKNPAGLVKRWLAELSLADKAEEKWRKEGEEIYGMYDAEKAKANSFNILWSNTETMLPAVYNSTPQPDVRRRFRDPDPTGKVASTVLERALSYQIDDYDFDGEIEDVVLDVLLPGRGVARINYEPVFVQINGGQAGPAPAAGAFIEPKGADAAGQATAAPPQEGAGPAAAAPYEKLVSQAAQCCHVQWDKFRRGPGKRWKDVPWVSFEHEFTYDMALEKFGPKVAQALKYDDADGADTVIGKAKSNEAVRAIFKVTKVYEIWDREERRVLFISPTLKKQPCLVVPDPLKLRQFLPLPKPVYAIPSSRSLVPKPLYRMYEQQAKELDQISGRINKIIKGLRIRGLYSSQIQEAGDLLDAEDNAMLPIENPSALAEQDLNKLIWILPVDTLARVLEYLYKSRDQIKQAIYEITGIADVIRGATNPNETLGAQKLKSQWGSLRIQKLQREIQRFIRDMLRLKAEVIAEQFTPEQLAAMTNVQLPDQQAKMQAQAAAQQAQMAQQPPPPEAQQVLSQPTWDDVKALLQSDQMRQYRVDIETDSTVAETLNQDMQGLAEVLQQVSTIIGAVAQGLPMDVAKAVALSVIRRARMGSAVEDAIEALQQPPPPQVEAPPPDHSVEVAQIKADTEKQIAQMREQAATERAQMQEQAKTERESFAKRMESMMIDNKTQLEAAVRLIVAEISASKAANADAATQANARREFAADVQ